MSETKPATAPASSPPAKGNPARLIFLLLGLLIVVGAYAYDYTTAAPQTQMAYEKLQSFVETQNGKGIKEADLVRSKDVQQVIGFAPTWTEVKDDHTVEWYCWWGKVPVLATRRSFITVMYDGQEPRRYRAHYQNAEPSKEDLPGYIPPAITEEEYTEVPAGSNPTALPGMVGPPAGAEAGPKKGGKGKRGKENGADDQPATEEKPAEEKPADEKPADEKPADEKPADEKPADEKPAEEKPAADTPAAEKPAAEEKSDAAPKAEDSPAAEPAAPPAAGEAPTAPPAEEKPGE